MTVCTYPWAQIAEVSTIVGEMRLPPQKVPPSMRRAAWCGNWPGVAGWPFTIFGA